MNLKEKMALADILMIAGLLLAILGAYGGLAVPGVGGLALLGLGFFLLLRWKRCPHCGSWLGRDWLPNFCPHCGKAIDQERKG